MGVVLVVRGEPEGEGKGRGGNGVSLQKSPVVVKEQKEVMVGSGPTRSRRGSTTSATPGLFCSDVERSTEAIWELNGTPYRPNRTEEGRQISPE